MPSTHGGKRRVLVSRKQKHKNRKSQQTRKKRHFKHGRRLKHNAISKHGKSSHKKPKDSSLYDSKTLQQLHQDKMYMTTKAKGIMIAFVKNLYRWVSAEAERLRRERKRSSAGFGVARTRALKSVVPGKCNKYRGNSPKRGSSRHMKVS